MTEQEKQVLAFAAAKKGKRFGDGECWTLVERALESAKAVTSTDIHGSELANTVDYVWGEEITIGAAGPGDIIQFEDGWNFTRTVSKPDGAEQSKTKGVRGHHTAIVERVITRGIALKIISQNLPVGTGVASMDFYFAPTTFKEGENTVEITVSGVATFYRPRRKP